MAIKRNLMQRLADDHDARCATEPLVFEGLTPDMFDDDHDDWFDLPCLGCGIPVREDCDCSEETIRAAVRAVYGPYA